LRTNFSVPQKEARKFVDFSYKERTMNQKCPYIFCVPRARRATHGGFGRK
jgi:hypothetical protein